jgi:beta-galactosidase
MTAYPVARLTRLLAPALVLLSALNLRSADRTEVTLNPGWMFHFGETPGAEQSGFADTQWQPVSLPHTWNAFDGQDGIKGKKVPGISLKGDYARGSGWYRRALSFDPSWEGRRVYLQFDGANRRTDVFVNGSLVGSHIGGNARFRFDITALLRRDIPNCLAVRVNNEDNDSIPVSGDFTFFGGLYRSVSILVTDPVHIATLDYASPGVYLIQRRVAEDGADIDALVKVSNDGAGPAEASVRVSVAAADGTAVVTGSAALSLVAGGTSEVRIPLHVSSPHLWNGRADPYLYRATATVTSGSASDQVVQPLGLRYYRVDPNQGLILNGKHLDLHGAARHQDRQDKGWAISEADDREDFAMMMEMGCTANRVAHYQQSQTWYTLADQQGMVQWSEVPFVDEARPSAAFFNNALDQMRELIRQNFNHPAIFFWGCGNENFDEGKGFAEGIAQYGPVQERQIQALNALAHAEDPTRLTTYASFHSETEVNLVLPGQKPVSYKGEPQRWYTDVTDFNKYFGWYYGEPSDNAVFFDSLHTRNPTQCIGVSEYGAGGAVTIHEDVPYGPPAFPRVPMESMRRRAFAKEHPEEYQAYYHEETWRVFKDRPYLWSKFIWNMFDFASDGRDEGDHPGRNDKGLVSFDRKVRKDAFYFYKANWSAEPVLYIASRRFTQRSAAETSVKVYTNATQATLSVNGRAVGPMAADDIHIARWSHVTLQPGPNTVRVEAIIDGKPVVDECTWTVAAPAPKS